MVMVFFLKMMALMALLSSLTAGGCLTHPFLPVWISLHEFSVHEACGCTNLDSPCLAAQGWVNWTNMLLRKRPV